MSTVAENTVAMLLNCLRHTRRGDIKFPPKSNIDSSRLSLSTTSRIKQYVFQTAWHQLVAHNPPEFNLSIGRKTIAGDFPEGEYFAAACPTPFEFFEILPTMARVTNESLLVEVDQIEPTEQHAGETHIKFALLYPQKSADEYIEFIMVFFITKVANCFSMPFPLSRVHFANKPRLAQKVYESYYQCPDLRFEQESFALVYDTDSLKEISGKSQNDFVYKTLKQRFTESKEFGLRDGEFLQNLRNAIKENLRDPNFSLSLIAEKLKMSQRTLQRRTLKLDLTFKQVCHQIQMDEAKRMLQNNLNVAEVARNVGFLNASAFSSSYRNYFGILPSMQK